MKFSRIAGVLLRSSEAIGLEPIKEDYQSSIGWTGCWPINVSCYYPNLSTVTSPPLSSFYHWKLSAMNLRCWLSTNTFSQVECCSCVGYVLQTSQLTSWMLPLSTFTALQAAGGSTALGPAWICVELNLCAGAYHPWVYVDYVEFCPMVFLSIINCFIVFILYKSHRLCLFISYINDDLFALFI